MIKTQTKLQEKVGNDIFLNGKELAYLRECTDKFGYKKLNLLMEGMERRWFVRETILFMGNLLLQKTPDVEERICSKFDSEYQRDWFASEAEFSSEKNRDLRKVLRMLNYIEENGFNVIAVALPYQSAFSRPVQYRGQQLAGIRGKFDFVLEKNEQIFLISIMSGESHYSANARKEENLPYNSVELLVAQLAGYTMYERFKTQLWYIGNKDDTGANMSDFEHRNGKNIVEADFSSMTSSEVFQKFLNLLGSNVACDCKNCFYNSLCNLPSLRREVVIKESDEKKMQPVEKKFTSYQKTVIEHVNGPMCVIAVPGAGKTTALVHRLARLIEKGVDPEKILMVTFTNKATAEIQDRVTDMIYQTKRFPTISTYNALGFSILKENPLYVGGKRLKLADDADRFSMIYSAIANNPVIKDVSYAGLDKQYGLIRQLDGFFLDIESKGKEWFEKKYSETKDTMGILKVYDSYKELYEKGNFIRYDEQISIVNDLFEKYPELVARYAHKYEYIMVDEFQDTNEEQANMIYTLAKPHNNIVVVGDDDQALYGWRGGSSIYMLNFPQDFPSAKMVYMEDNFRSNGNILKLADALIKNNGVRYEKSLRAHVEAGYKPKYVKGTPGNIMGIISALLEKGVQPRDISVLGRTNKRLEEVQKLLYGIVPVTVPKDYLVEDAVFLVIHDVLKLFFTDCQDDMTFYRTMHYMGAAEFLSTKQGKESLYQAMIREKKWIPFERTPECMSKYYKRSNEPIMFVGYHIMSMFEKIAYADIPTMLHSILYEVFGLHEHRVVDTILDMVDDKCIGSAKELFTTLDNMLIYHVTTRVGYELTENAVSLLTCHDAKGKEFPYVIVYSIEDFSDSEEEIRTVYVAVTRAKKGLYLLETSKPKDIEVYNMIRPYAQVVTC